MNIAILGAGNSGCALAADYAARGHEVTLIKTSHSLHDDNFSHLCATGGRMRIHEFGTDTACVIAHLSRDVADVRGKDIVLLCTQTGYHPDVLRRVVPFLTPGQILLMVPGYLSTAYALGLHPADGVILAEAESNFIDGRIGAPGEFQVGFRNVRNPIGVYPHSALPAARAVLDRLGTPFVYLKSVAEAALHNPNMIVHTVGAVMSIPRIEATHGDFCMYHEAFTPSTWNLLEALDGEKMRVLEHLGCDPVPYVEACKFRNSLDDARDAKEVFFAYAAMPERAKGPLTVRSRYITEDVPQGLGLLESLGAALGVPTPVCSSLIEIASAALGCDLRAQGRTIERLGRTTSGPFWTMPRGALNHVPLERTEKGLPHVHAPTRAARRQPDGLSARRAVVQCAARRIAGKLLCAPLLCPAGLAACGLPHIRPLRCARPGAQPQCRGGGKGSPCKQGALSHGVRARCPAGTRLRAGSGLCRFLHLSG